jgi:hypothetical protein
MTSENIIHQCPFCELRFAYMAEVKDHVQHDHPEHASTVDVQTVELPHGGA